MVTSGAVFAIFENFWILLLAAVVGVISATGGDFGPFRSIEESTISHLTTPDTRSDVLSWYVATSSLGSAAGTEFAGRAVDLLQNTYGWALPEAYHAIFWLYVVMGATSIVFTLLMSAKCEVEDTPAETEASYTLLNEQRAEDDGGEDSEELRHQPNNKPGTAQKTSYIAQISSETRTIMYKLWFLLTVDSLADGMVSMSLTNYYVDRKFHLSKSTLGDITSAAYFLVFPSTVFAGPLARYLGLIKTMVFTHLPSSMAVLLFPIPRGVPMTVTLLFIRMGLNNMDQAPRSAFIAAVVKPEERTAVMGITSMLRTLASATGPSITGSLAGSNKFWIAFLAAGALRISYDMGLFAMFVNMKLYTHETKNPIHDPRRSNDEEETVELTELEPAQRAAAARVE
ncbi:hypothetical protein H2203_003162 [Taxawa tesnikishii (nom. ined.)]|nr:hypothetical protein H2203_003162 [Dothideales sp. JES 119]